jgi:hypothetical protein
MNFGGFQRVTVNFSTVEKAADTIVEAVIGEHIAPGDAILGCFLTAVRIINQDDPLTQEEEVKACQTLSEFSSTLFSSGPSH